MLPAFPTRRLGVLFVVSGPSGSGKTTLCRQLTVAGETMYSVSATTRPPRPGEVHGRDYFFFSELEFEQKLARGEFFEHARVHGNLYGTLKSFVRQNLEDGHDVIMDIDVAGAAQIRASTDDLVKRCRADVFILPPSVDSLKERLANRGTEAGESLELRLKNALTEIAHWPEYDYALVSGSREEDLARFRAILIAERVRVGRQL
ncbi:MAG TPA: guanylate kinase [Verrucomicrobiaceae bacterium]